MIKDKPLKIAAIGMRGIPSNYSGIERACESLYTRLAARGHQISVYCRPECMPTDVEYYHGVRLLRMGTLKHKSLESLSHSLVSTLHATLTMRYDVIHLHALAAGLFIRIPGLRKVPTIVTVHGLDWQRAKWRGPGSTLLRKGEQSIAKHANEIVAISLDLQNYFAQQYGLEVPYIPNGIERSGETEPERRLLESFHLKLGEYVAYVGRLVPEKRVLETILAFRQLRTRNKLAIIGEAAHSDSYIDTLRHAAASDPRVVFTGLQTGTALQSLYIGAASFVLFSDLEGLPMSLLEAMERGIPAVVSDIAPHRQLLGSFEAYDLFAQCGDVDELANRLQRVVDNHAFYKALASQVQCVVREKYCWDAIALATEKVFQRVFREAHDRRHSHLRASWSPVAPKLDPIGILPNQEIGETRRSAS